MAKLVWEGRVAVDQINGGAARGLGMALDHLLTEANKTIPHEEGHMQDGGDVSIDEGALVGTVYYGLEGPSVPYVVRQHEELDFRHDPGRRAKWLELASQEEAETMHRIIAEEVRKAFQ